MSTIAALSPSNFSWQIPEMFVEPVNKAAKLWQNFQTSLGAPVQDVMLPRAKSLSQEHIDILQKEKDFFAHFWDPSYQVNPHLPYHAAIRKHFVWKKESLPIEMQGNPMKVDYSIIEPSHQKASQNFVFLLGNLSVHDDNITGIYPFLASYMKERAKNPNMPGIRFILISQYDTKTQDNTQFVPKNVDEIGQVLAKTLESLQKEKGAIHQIMAYSLGTIALSSALPYISTEELPKNIYWDRGPSSLEVISHAHGFKGWFLWHCAKFAGWDFDLGQNIRKYLANRKDQKIYIAEVEHDCYFAKKCSLAQSPHLESLGKEQGFHKFSFDFAKQLHDERCHHGLHNGLLDHFHLKNPTTELKTHESMADLLIRSFPKNTSTSKSLLRWAFSK
ncbi:MAG: hypothetical protein K2Y01_08030 [Rhabdochlamydiaceae bacterium]|nr:hypothetical protein [Rhabdochlamydiaceae bacterium]